MKLLIRIPLFVMMGLVLLACGLHVSNSGDAAVPAKPDGRVRVATYNVHYILVNRQTGPWSAEDWESRKGPMNEALQLIDADVIAFQEMESFAGGNADTNNLARAYLLDQNPRLAAAAVGDWRDFPSTQPIFYRRDMFRVADQGWFFFSDTPDVIYSRTFDGSYPAFASWVRLSPHDGSASLTVFNVHFEHKSGSNRLKSAELVAGRIAPLVETGERVVLAGDMNALGFAQTVKILEAAGLVFLPVDGATYHFDRGINLFGAIDHIAVSENLLPAADPTVLRRKFEGIWPSDHYPVFTDVSLAP
ncbi:endonuclease/exonuclease/phosphatase family protein [Qingshengfaniella alkalisoli]|uniref:Endonuclease n=1 Tax=Qingshengfaniella alkalisoli TaxID=2599296 RepID=A0A5B8IA00_9RHOB|nr:endonuclease/exonuclease/phosphatase family protein [Qingshengfaniella alkalisoli]QDY71205.1 endonuclease [Qingshengfaniella alkalisoli]